MNAFQVKDIVVLKENKKERGIIVDIIGKGRYKVLWDRDWHTGRTRVHFSKDITRFFEHYEGRA